jgi:hypothetical protein
MQSILNQMVEFLGVLLKDLLRYQYAFFSGDHNYLTLKNRLEKISLGPNSHGYVCLWPYTSRLHAPLVLPFLGKQLLRASCIHSSFVYSDERNYDESIEVSVLIGHRGLQRLPLLLATLRSFASQRNVGLECIVIEQDDYPKIKEQLPKWVKHVFQPTSNDSLTYNRSAAFNCGAHVAKGKILLLHDNDMLVPINYCYDILELVRSGFAVINTKRFIFYLNQTDSEKVIKSVSHLKELYPEYIVQNLEAGGSVAILKSSYFQIGGMDEEFIGWGGEDLEFWQRCASLDRWVWGFHCLVHLWHESQPLKHMDNNPNIDRFNQLESVAVARRIKMLKERNWK